MSYQTLKVAIPHVEGQFASIDPNALPHNVIQRMLEMAFAVSIRSAANSARSVELDAAEKTAREAHEAEQEKNKGKKDFKASKFNSKAFRENFTFTADMVAAATARVDELLAGTIRAARGESGANKLLTSTVRNNILAVLKSKGKTHKDAVAMIGDDPFAFIEKTARKRAGEGDDAETVYKAELAKLNAQYVDPARALLQQPETTASDGEEGEEGEAPEGGADDLI